MIPSLSPPGKHTLILKVIFMEFIICHERLVTPCIAIYAGNFKYTFWKRWVLDTSHEQRKAVSVRMITARSAHCEPSGWDELAAARRGCPERGVAHGLEASRTLLLCKWNKSDTGQHDGVPAFKQCDLLYLPSLYVFSHFMRKQRVTTKCNTRSSHRKFTAFHQSAVFYWITLEYSLLLQKVPIVCQLALGKDYLLPKAEKINHPSSYEIHLILQEDFR